MIGIYHVGNATSLPTRVVLCTETLQLNHLCVLFAYWPSSFRSFLPVRGVLKFSEASRRTAAVTTHETVWQQLKELRKCSDSTVCAESRHSRNRSSSSSNRSKRQLLAAELVNAQAQLHRATLRCVPLRRRRSEVQSDIDAYSVKSTQLHSQLLRSRQRVDRLGGDIERVLSAGTPAAYSSSSSSLRGPAHCIPQLPQCIRHWGQLLPATADSAAALSAVQQALGCRGDSVLTRSLRQAVESGQQVVQDLAAAADASSAQQACLALVQSLQDKIEKQRTHYMQVCSALTRWLQRNGGA
eukprot:10525-Heterococcus_DN1.PRE.4